jgi:DNA (cytosine-5)-methyltransferase 1
MKIIPSLKRINAKEKKFKAISFFSGCGGSSTGLKLAGFNVLYANEFVKEAVAIYKVNHPGTYVDSRDIRSIDPQEVLKIIKLNVGELDYLDASPPCSSFSSAGIKDKGWGQKRKYSGNTFQRTDDLFFELTRMVNHIQPKIVCAENVPGLIKGKAKGYFVEFLSTLQGCGYVVEAAILDASFYDVPQKRKRLIFIGVRNDIAKLGFRPCFPDPNPYIIKVSELYPEIVGIRNPHAMRYDSSQRPFPTITASCGTVTETAKFSCGGFVELKSGERRKLTIPELLRISSFPIDFKLTGTFAEQWERVGRAVPPMLMYHVASAIKHKILRKL